jgi:hypothetical protein
MPVNEKAERSRQESNAPTQRAGQLAVRST